MTLIERTAYPRFKRLITARELHLFFSPSREEVAWCQERADSEDHQLSLLLLLKSYQRMARFPKWEEVPDTVVDFVRKAVELPEGTAPGRYASVRTAEAHRGLVRARVEGIRFDAGEARQVAREVIRAEAGSKNNPADLINVALEQLVQKGLELPAFSTLDRMAMSIRTEVNSDIFTRVYERVGEEERAGLLRLLTVVGLDRKTVFNQLKQSAQRATWSNMRKLADHRKWLDGLGETGVWLEGLAAGKIADFAGEAEVADAGVLQDYAEVKRVTLIACLVHKARMRVRDDLTTMFAKRVAIKAKRARTELEEIRSRQQAIVEGLIGNYRTLLRQVDTDGPAQRARAKAGALTKETLDALEGLDEAAGASEVNRRLKRQVAAAFLKLAEGLMVQSNGLFSVTSAVDGFGGFDAQYAQIEKVSAHHGDNWEVLMHGHLKADRSVMLNLLESLDLVATSEDSRVLDAFRHLLRFRNSRDYIPVRGVDDKGRDTGVVDIRFATQNWQKIVRDRTRPNSYVRRHFEAMVLFNLAEELRCGDIAVPGSEEYADWSRQLLGWREVEERLPAYLVEVGFREAGDGTPFDAAAFRAQLQDRLTEAAAAADCGYPENEGLFIDPKTGVPTLEKYRADERRPSAVKLEQAIKARLPERSLLGVLARTAYWIEWWRRFGPASGHDPKLKDAFGRYVITTFVNGTNMGPYEAARHISGVSGHELSATANRHFTVAKLNQAITDVVNAHGQLDMSRAWGDGTAVAADGTHMDTYLNNLVAETSIRYGRPGGIAYHHVADTYIALFTHFIPCGVWEAVYIIEGLLKNESEIQPTTIHADTQGQSYPVFSLAHLLGFELMPRIRNWKDLVFFRPTRQTSYVHIDALFGEAGRNVIDWDLIEHHFKDLMRVALSVREGTVSSVLLLRRLRSGSRKNAHYAAFREVGRVIRTIQLLRYLTDPQMRRRVTAATNKVEAYNGFSEWVRFGNRGVITDNDPVEQEKTVKFNALLSNCLIFHNTLDIAQAVRELQAEGWKVEPEDLAEVSPYLTEKIMRFGEYSTHELDLAPEAYEQHLDVDFTKFDPQNHTEAS
ncbi:Tn3 family transposase [Kitasatospora sp. NPDC001225]